MKHKLTAIIVFISIIVFGGYNIKVQSYSSEISKNIVRDRKTVESSNKKNYKEIIIENNKIAKKNIIVLKDGKSWFDETLQLLKKEDLESIMFLYSKGVENDISNIIYDISLYSTGKNEYKAQELEINWDSFCDNFEYAYFNKNQNAEYRSYIEKAIESMDKIISQIDEI